MSGRRSLRALLAERRAVVGTWAQIPHPEVVEILGRFGFEFAIVDLEHGHFGLERATDLIRACEASGMAAAARVRDLAGIGAVLDAGATAVVVPGIETSSEARAAVAATRYAPEGTRGACPCVRAVGQFTTDWAGHAAADDAGAILLVETRAGLEAIEEIVAVPGPLALMLGPFDLSVSLGHGGDWRHPDVTRGLDRMCHAAAAAGLAVIAPVFDADPDAMQAQVRRWRQAGAAALVVGTDKILLAEAARQWSAAGRGAPD